MKSPALAGGPDLSGAECVQALPRTFKSSLLDRVLVVTLIALLVGSLVLRRSGPSAHELNRKQAPVNLQNTASSSVAPRSLVGSSPDFHESLDTVQVESKILIGLISDIIENVSADLSGEKARGLAEIIVRESKSAGYDPLFVAAVIKSESTFNKGATSHRGALGLMQIMPTTGRYISELSSQDWEGSHRLADPGYNIRLGVAYLKYLEESFDADREHMLIAYNWGPANLNSALRKGAAIPQGSLKYAKSIISTHKKWRQDLGVRLALETPTEALSVG